MGEPQVRVERREPQTVVLTIDRPDALNALNARVLDELSEAIQAAQRDGVRFVVVTGAGRKAFVAGADIAAMQGLDRQAAKGFARRGQRVMERLSSYPGVTVAAVNGFALGGGMELAMACDLILCDENARFGQPEVNLGVIPGFGGTQHLVRLVGAHRARELILTGRQVKADEAVRIGIALKSVPPGTVLDAALELVQTLAQKGPRALLLAKQAMQVAEALDLDQGMQEEADLFGRCFATRDQKEGMAAFLEKRPAQFRGE
jgi:enoyl-CoA hydratase